MKKWRSNWYTFEAEKQFPCYRFFKVVSVHFYRFCSLFMKYRPLPILREKKMKFTATHTIYRSILNPTHGDSEKYPELQWNSSRFFLFSHNTMNIPKILVTYKLSLRLSNHWPQFWDSWAAHSTASLSPCCRKISMCSPFSKELRIQTSWWDALC